MKYIWEEDVVCGMFVCKTPLGNADFEPSSWNAKWMHKIGFQQKGSTGTCLISMSDGMVGQKHTPKEMAEYLTQNDMMPMPHKWVIKMLDYMRDFYREG